MRFSKQRLFIYDREVFRAASLPAIAGRAPQPDSFALSGLTDLAGALSIAQEYFQQFPTIKVKELARTSDGAEQDVDSVYNEPVLNARYQFDRTLDLSSYVSFGDPDKKHSKAGEVLTQPLNAAFCLPDLHDVDYFPDVGDQVIFAGRLYDVAIVKVLASDYFQNTMVPLYVHAICGLHQFGDRLPPQVLDHRP